MVCSGIANFLHYLDDLFFCATPASPTVANALKIAIPLCQELGLPVAVGKLAGPATTITFLGIEIDSLQQELSLPKPKLACLLHSLHVWVSRRSASKQQLQSIISLLNHVATVVRPGRTFMGHLINTMSIPVRQHHQVRLNLQCRTDISWWLAFTQDWNGVTFFQS